MRKDIRLLEKVQKRAVKMISGLNGLTYEEKLKKLDLLSLEDRRLSGDMITTWKILNHHDDANWKQFFQFVDAEPMHATRHSTNPINLKLKSFNLDVRKHSFAVRVPKEWNSLPIHIREARQLNSFKNRYDAHMKEKARLAEV